VAFPDDVLTKDEHVVLHLHPHWKALIRPALVVLLGIALLVLGWIFLPDGGAGTVGLYVIAAAALVLAVWFSLWPLLVWRTTHYVFTNERVLLREGVFNRQQRDIPLSRVNDVSSNQSLLDRLLGCGNLTVESAGERGQSVLEDIPRVVQVQKVAYELVEADHERRTVNDSDLRAAFREAANADDKE